MLTVQLTMEMVYNFEVSFHICAYYSVDHGNIFITSRSVSIVLLTVQLKMEIVL